MMTNNPEVLRVRSAAMDAFWAKVAELVTEAKSGDLTPEASEDFTRAVDTVITRWLELNAPTLVNPREGDRVEVCIDLERGGHFEVAAGARGTVSEVNDDLIAVKMDDPIDGAEPWDNEVHWANEDRSLFWHDVKPLTEDKIHAKAE